MSLGRADEHVRDELGGYVLGALEPGEDARVRAHLASCDACRAEHARLEGLPALLALGAAPARLDPPPPLLEDATLAALTARRRAERAHPRRAGVLGALAGAAATLALLAATGLLGGDPGSAARTVTLSAPSPSPARAIARLRPLAGGTRVDVDVRGLAPTRAGELYEVWFVGRGGRVSAGTFTVTRAGPARLTLTTAAVPERYERLGVTREPDGLDPARNGPSVLAGSLAG